jgi:flagellar assembly protein FliH
MAATKFLFDVDFGGGRAQPELKITAAAHEAALVDAEARGYARGLNAAEVRERTDAERRAAAAFERIAGALVDFVSNLKPLEGRLEAEAVEVAFAVARKLAPELIAREPSAEVAALIASCFAELRSAPHAVVRISESLLATAQGQIEQLARSRGFEGRLIVLGEDDIAVGDCRIEWADGGVIRDRAATEAAIGEAITRYIAARVDTTGAGGE